MKQLEFPELRQTYEWDCGAKALQAVLTYYGIGILEEKLIKYAKTNSKYGTSIPKMREILKKFKLKIDARPMTTRDLKSFIDKKVPIILLLQAWNGKKINYANDFHDGHWVVVIGYDNDKFIFEDPYSFERTFLKNRELKDRWHAKENNKKFFNYGIAVYGKKPKYSSDKITHMD